MFLRQIHHRSRSTDYAIRVSASISGAVTSKFMYLHLEVDYYISFHFSSIPFHFTHSFIHWHHNVGQQHYSIYDYHNHHYYYHHLYKYVYTFFFIFILSVNWGEIGNSLSTTYKRVYLSACLSKSGTWTGMNFI